MVDVPARSLVREFAVSPVKSRGDSQPVDPGKAAVQQLEPPFIDLSLSRRRHEGYRAVATAATAAVAVAGTQPSCEGRENAAEGRRGRDRGMHFWLLRLLVRKHARPGGRARENPLAHCGHLARYRSPPETPPRVTDNRTDEGTGPLNGNLCDFRAFVDSRECGELDLRRTE